MKPLSLDNLRTFVTVVDTGGYAKAGEQLGLSQPAISLQIKKLEEQLGKSLFSKAGQKHVINQHGQTLYEYAQRMLQTHDEIFQHFQQTPLRGKLRLGIPSEFATTLLPSIVGDFSQRYPEVSLEVTSALSKSLLFSHQRNSFDLIMALANPEEAGEGDTLLTDDLVWASDRKLANSLNSLPLVLAPEGCMYRSRVIDKLKQQTLQWRISYTNADLSGITAAIKQGLGITALARSSLPQELFEIRHKQLPTLGQIKICLLNRSQHHPQASQALADFLAARIRRQLA